MTPVLQITGVQKRYQSLRPLRIQELTIAAAERVAVSGFDAGAAEVLVNLVTGASLPIKVRSAFSVIARPTSSAATNGWRHSIASASSACGACWSKRLPLSKIWQCPHARDRSGAARHCGPRDRIGARVPHSRPDWR